MKYGCALFARPYASRGRTLHEFSVSVNLPYFDVVLQRLEKNDPEFEIAFGRHVHWGYWADPSRARQTAEDYALAAEALSQQVYSAANVAAGQQILDVGCGFGGTIASLNENFSGLNLVGVNIDERQLERARLKVAAQNGNRIDFKQGDACALPIADQAFDRVLAVECIFHFPDRRRFFDEAFRVLKPGGYLALSDLIPAAWYAPVARLGASAGPTQQLFGQCQVCTMSAYHKLAEESGFAFTFKKDITANTIPTYDFLLALRKQLTNAAFSSSDLAMHGLKLVGRLGMVRYQVLGFQKPA